MPQNQEKYSRPSTSIPGASPPTAVVSAPRSKISLLDPHDFTPKQVIQDNCVIWSSENAWKGITAEVYEFETMDLPEFQIVNHNIVFHIANPASVDLTIDGRNDTRTRRPGDLSLFPAGTAIRARSPHPHRVLVVSLSHELMGHAASDGLQNHSFDPHPILYLRDTHIRHICKALKAEAAADFSSGPLYGESLGLALAIRFLGRYSKSPPLIRRGGLPPRMLRRVVDFIDSELHTSLRMESLAQIAGLSQFRFAHNFKAETGMSPHQFVMRARIERAKSLLRETDLTIVEIALAIGLQSSSQFNALFKRELNTTPGDFRRSFR
jgi:AraC family transcriptional regulator